MLRKSALVKTIVLSCAMAVSAVAWSAQQRLPGVDYLTDEKPPYDRKDALLTMINPHNQISETGEVLWGSCFICHREVPDIKSKSIKDVKLYFEDDPNQLCRNCHKVKKHPANEGVSAGFIENAGVPDHLVVPSPNKQMNIRMSLKDVPTILPMDPKTGKIICATCHNPHERGLLPGKADWGGDYIMRWRSAGLDICQYCHRK